MSCGFVVSSSVGGTISLRQTAKAASFLSKPSYKPSATALRSHFLPRFACYHGTGSGGRNISTLSNTRIHMQQSSPATKTVDKKFKSMQHGYDYDLFVIGAGSGGTRASRIASGYGAKVAVAEEMHYGGTCVHKGCVPKKLFVYGSHYGHVDEEARNFGWDIKVENLDWSRLIENKNAEISRLNGVYTRILENAGVERIDGRAVLMDSHTIEVNGKKLTADKILIAVGGRPSLPSIPGVEFGITSNEFFFLKELPKRSLIAGGGYIAVEFAGILNGFGSQVTLAHRGGLFLRGFDHEVREFMREQMTAQNINLKFDTEIQAIERNPDGSLKATLSGGHEIEVDQVVFATGRVPNTNSLGLEKAGVAMGPKGEILVNSKSQTNIPNIFAVGDVTDRVNLTPVALAEGHCFADEFFGNKPRRVDYENIPTAVFCNPTIGTCGLTEEQADKKYGMDNIDIYKTSFRPMKQTIALGKERTFMKLVVERSTDRVVGCHIIEPSAGEVIQLVGVAMKAGATKAHFDQTIGVHPTAAEELCTIRNKSG